jgi:hypothetical protein
MPLKKVRSTASSVGSRMRSDQLARHCRRHRQLPRPIDQPQHRLGRRSRPSRSSTAISPRSTIGDNTRHSVVYGGQRADYPS